MSGSKGEILELLVDAMLSLFSSEAGKTVHCVEADVRTGVGIEDFRARKI